MQRVAHPQIPSMFGQERASLGEASAQRPGGQVMSLEQAMHTGAMQTACGDDAGALQQADDAPDGTARTLAFDAQNLLGERGADGPAAAAIGTVLGEQSLKAAVAIR